jgi:hypothetical protein
MSNGYNGWSNFETWKTNLELVDGIDIRDFGCAITCEDDRDAAVSDLAERLEQYVDEVIEWPEDNTFAHGIVQSFLARVDWEEIAEHYVDDYIAELV